MGRSANTQNLVTIEEIKGESDAVLEQNWDLIDID